MLSINYYDKIIMITGKEDRYSQRRTKCKWSFTGIMCIFSFETAIWLHQGPFSSLIRSTALSLTHWLRGQARNGGKSVIGDVRNEKIRIIITSKRRGKSSFPASTECLPYSTRGYFEDLWDLLPMLVWTMWISSSKLRVLCYELSKNWPYPFVWVRGT